MSSADLEQVLAIDHMSFSMPWPASAYNYELNEKPSLTAVGCRNGLAGSNRRIVGLLVLWLIVDEAHMPP